MNKPIEIGIDASRLAVGQRTGTENYAYQVIRGLFRADRTNRYTLYFNGPPARGMFDALPPRWKVRAIPFPRLWTHLRLSLELLLHRPRVLFVPAHVVPLIHPRTVVTIHDLGYLFYPEAHRRFSRWYLQFSTRWSARQARRIIAVSAATARDIVKHTGVKADKIRVVHHGYDARFKHITDEAQIKAAKQRIGLLPSERYVLYVGTIQPRKNLVRLVEAWAKLGEDVAGYKLVLGGKPGWLYADIYARIRVLGLEGYVSLPGYIEDDDLPALYSGASLFAFVSLYEGFGLPALEALACGTPTLVSNTTSLPEIVGDAAILCDPEDVDSIANALHQGLTDERLRQRLQVAGPEQAARFSWQRCAEETLAVLLEASEA
jgi:glycosyltransferase involved in cell wall biosynthesis